VSSRRGLVANPLSVACVGLVYLRFFRTFMIVKDYVDVPDIMM
jgi:hypothetical protein